jgi:hypothetical protein
LTEHCLGCRTKGLRTNDRTYLVRDGAHRETGCRTEIPLPAAWGSLVEAFGRVVR